MHAPRYWQTAGGGNAVTGAQRTGVAGSAERNSTGSHAVNAQCEKASPFLGLKLPRPTRPPTLPTLTVGMPQPCHEPRFPVQVA